MNFFANAPDLLLDRDGTLIEEKHYLSDPDQVTLAPGVADGLAALAGRGARFFLVSNQSGIGRGYFSEAAALAVNERLARLLAAHGVRFCDMIFCPHAPEDACACRKPGTGMWRILRERHGLKPENCVMIGDKSEDMAFASAAGLALRILVLTGHGRDTARKLGLTPPDERRPEPPQLPEPQLPELQLPELQLPELQLIDTPPSPSHPQLLLPSFHFLERGLELFSLSRKRSCGA